MKDLKEVTERIDNIDEIIDSVIKNYNELQNKLTKSTEILISNQSEKLDTVINELRNINNTDEVNQLFYAVKSINDRLEKQPASINKNIRILLFPEDNAGKYYKIVFGRLIPWLSSLVVLTYIFIISYKGISGYRYNAISKTDSHYEKAWLFLREHSKKKTIMLMEDAWRNTENR